MAVMAVEYLNLKQYDTVDLQTSMHINIHARAYTYTCTCILTYMHTHANMHVSVVVLPNKRMIMKIHLSL